MKHIYTDDNIVTLHAIKNVLERNDIASFIKNEHGAVAGPSHGINNVLHELWILNDQDYEKASQVMETEITSPSSTVAWICSHCGEENDGSFEICWKCQNTPHNT